MLVRSCTISVTSDFGKPKITLTRPRLVTFPYYSKKCMGSIQKVRLLDGGRRAGFGRKQTTIVLLLLYLLFKSEQGEGGGLKIPKFDWTYFFLHEVLEGNPCLFCSLCILSLTRKKTKISSKKYKPVQTFL